MKKNWKLKARRFKFCCKRTLSKLCCRKVPDTDLTADLKGKEAYVLETIREEEESDNDEENFSNLATAR